jgi:hypothetical protein
MPSRTRVGSRATVLPFELLLLASLAAVGAYADIITLNSTSPRIQYQGPWSTSDNFRVSLGRSQTFAIFWSGTWSSARTFLSPILVYDFGYGANVSFKELASVFRVRFRVMSRPYSSPLIMTPLRRHWNQVQKRWCIPSRASSAVTISCSCLGFLPTSLRTFICIT